MAFQSSPQHPVHLADIRTRHPLLERWERVRHRQAHWIIEMISEAFGVFVFCYGGVGPTAAYVIGNILEKPLGSLFTIGLGYGFGVVLSLCIVASTSGGHINPAVTVTFCLFKGMPRLKALRYIIAQVLGAYIACLLVYTQWKTLIKEAEAALIAAGTFDSTNFTPDGTAGILALYAAPGASLGIIFVNEFVVDFVIGMVIWASLDTTNFLIPPALGPWLVGFVYSTVIWGYVPPGLAANAARDVGGRMAAVSIWGLRASGGRYAAIAALTNIPATVLAYMVYSVIFSDSSRVVTEAQKEMMAGHAAHMEHRDHGVTYRASSSSDIEEKASDDRKDARS
ncbi:aquaporin-like protein [Amylostereum chailletii]|nr:aquaporin-like protein [Amylostereum chailletii]